MARHRYNVGENVEYVRDTFDGEVTPGAYIVTRLLPADGAEPQYRVKSAKEVHERTMRESQLRIAGSLDSRAFGSGVMG